MGYTGHTSTPPRSILVIIGGILAWVGLVGGVLVTTPQYHMAMTMKEEPVEMTWQELVDNGLTDNSHVRLLDVAIDQEEPSGFFEEMMDFDAELAGDEEELQQQAFEDFAEEFAQNVDFGQVIDTIMQPLKVYPKDQDPADFPAKVVVPISGWATEVAIDEVETSGTLTGRFTLSDGTDLPMKLAKVFMTTAMAAQQAELDAGKKTDQAESDQAEAGVDQAEAEQPAEPALKYVYEPVFAIPPESEAQQWFWLSGIAVVLGMVICGAGGPSIPCCFFFQVPSILSIFGYPLRYGRAGKTTRMVYTVIGFALIGYGYETMIVEGKFGQIDGDMVRASLGFVPTFVGAAAVLGAGTNMIVQRLNISLDPATNKKKYEPKISLSEACSLEPAEAQSACQFTDRYLMPSGDPLPEEMQQVAAALRSVGFEEPESIVCQDGLESRPVLIQLGCQDMVVADVEKIDGKLQTRLVSVLHDGITIVTLSSNISVEKETRFGTSGQYHQSQHDDPIEMFSAHLEQTIGMAEKRDTAVVTFDPSEAADVSSFGRRVLADIRTQYGEENTEVGSASYGRFHFPPRPVPSYEPA